MDIPNCPWRLSSSVSYTRGACNPRKEKAKRRQREAGCVLAARVGCGRLRAIISQCVNLRFPVKWSADVRLLCRGRRKPTIPRPRARESSERRFALSLSLLSFLAVPTLTESRYDAFCCSKGAREAFIDFSPRIQCRRRRCDDDTCRSIFPF